MAFNGSFTAALAANSLSQIVLTDNSTGSDGNLTGRTIYLYKADGTLLTGATINWPIADSSITLDVLDTDYSLSILVVWASSSPLPSPSEYTYTLLFSPVPHINDFIDGLIQRLSADLNLRRDKNFMDNLFQLYTEKDNSIQATDAGIQGSAQDAIDRALYMIENQNLYF